MAVARNIQVEDAWQFINDADWQDPAFSLEKAYVCAIFSALAYTEIPAFEAVKAENRAKVIPCLTYRELVEAGQESLVRSFLTDADFGRYFVAVRRYAVIVGVVTPKVIIVAIRGTVFLYDWLINVNVRKFRPSSWRKDRVRLHRGFFKSAYACREPIETHLRKILNESKSEVPVYVVGHSLGGAMAAIMHSLSGGRYKRWYDEYELLNGLRDGTHSAFTFGMPRYGNLEAVTKLRTPYHVYNDTDIVPTVPPRRWGFENVLTEYRADGEGIESVSKRDSLRFASWIGRLGTKRGIKDHDIELYIERIRSSIRTSQSAASRQL